MKMDHPPLLFLAFLSFFFFNCALSEDSIGIFDLSSALQLAQDIVHSQPQCPIQNELRSSHSSSSVSVKLESRENVRRSNHTDYKSLLLSRLQRDSARVKSITSRIQLLVANGDDESKSKSKSDLMNSDLGLSIPVTSGAAQGVGEFFARIFIGTPPKPYYMILDTGSELNWIQCQPCINCNHTQSDPIFDPTKSSSYSPLPCNSTQCYSFQQYTCPATKDHGVADCHYISPYEDGSFSSGELISETVSFGGGSTRVVNNFTLGCGRDSQGFDGSAGLSGMTRLPLSLPSQLNATSFSYCFVNPNNSSASSTLDFNFEPVQSPIVATMVKNRKVNMFYYIKLTGISVNDKLLPIPKSDFQLNNTGKGGVIVDSGTMITRLESKAYYVFRDAFRNATRGLKVAPEQYLLDTCYASKQETTVPIPTVQFHFGKGQIWKLLPSSYIIV